mmetsp:Transcript_26267/g.66852  ORF Transcript_26267/g.66852 Transcript_26267/m.66852 type:complete len:80 (-) Transcript_26267:2223-2462(-)
MLHLAGSPKPRRGRVDAESREEQKARRAKAERFSGPLGSGLCALRGCMNMRACKQQVNGSPSARHISSPPCSSSLTQRA